MGIGHMTEDWTGPWVRLLQADARGTGCHLTAAEVRRVLRDAPSIRKCMDCGETRPWTGPADTPVCQRCP